jgi:organic radical activating enzyme
VANPVPVSEVVAIVDALESFPRLHDSISLTGGEPLQHMLSLEALIPLLKERFPLYLETDGILWQALESCIDDMQMIGMDMKIPSATGLQSYWDEHKKFLAIAAKKDVFVKVVFARKSKLEELDTVIEIIKEIDSDIPLILQPVTPYGSVQTPPSSEQMLQWQGRAKQALRNVRVIPQTHKITGQI